MKRTLILGGRGFIGRAVAEDLASDGRVVVASRTPGADVLVDSGAALDDVLTAGFDQVVVAAQLTGAHLDQILERIDGPRWLVFSSAQVTAKERPPGVDVALAREAVVLRKGGTVLRPTMVFGRGGDANLTRTIRWIARRRIVLSIGDGAQLVQPVHVDDVAALVRRHREEPVPGCFGVGGDEAVPVPELVEELRELLGVRVVRVAMPLRVAVAAGRAIRLRPDQVRRLVEDKVVDIEGTCAAFGWRPGPLAHRLEQAVDEALA